MSEKMLPLPCPFCGGKAEIASERDLWQVRCTGGPKCATWPITNWRQDSSEVVAAWNRRYVCDDKNRDKVFAGDKVRLKTCTGYYKGIVTWRGDHVDWIILGEGDSFGWGIRSDKIELIRSKKGD